MLSVENFIQSAKSYDYICNVLHQNDTEKQETQIAWFHKRRTLFTGHCFKFIHCVYRDCHKYKAELS